MGGRPQAQVRSMIPVFLVVAGDIVQSPGKVGNLIVNKSCLLQRFRRGQEELTEFLLFGECKCLRAVSFAHGGVVFKGELIAG